MKKLCRTALLTLLFTLTLCVGAHAMENDTVKVGIKYGADAMASANLQNYSDFGGYAFGYYDGDRDFVELGYVGNEYEKITVTTETTYAVELDETFCDFDDARAAADVYGGYPSYVMGEYRVRIGTYPSKSDASAACGSGSHVAGNSPTGVKVFVTDTNTVLFAFDCSGLYSLGVQPIESGEKTVTWFRGYRYYGGFEYQRVTGGDLNVINVVNIDDYVKCVIPYEMSSDWPIEALKAQSVCARTYAATRTMHKSQGFDICTTTDCQVYWGTAACSAHSDAAVDGTAGEYLYYDGEIVREAVYYSCNGGASEDCKNVWGSDVPYLKGKIDPYEQYVAGRAEKYNWSTTYSASELTALLKSKGVDIGTVKNLYVSKLTDNGNVYEITFVGSKGTKTYQRESCRTILNLRSMRFSISGGAANQYYVNGDAATVSLSDVYVLSGSGKSTYSAAPEDTYVITSGGVAALENKQQQKSTDTFVISGSGNGHHVGLSQWGAYAMADLGYDYEEILQFYYTGVTIY